MNGFWGSPDAREAADHVVAMEESDVNDNHIADVSGLEQSSLLERFSRKRLSSAGRAGGKYSTHDQFWRGFGKGSGDWLYEGEFGSWSRSYRTDGTEVSPEGWQPYYNDPRLVSEHLCPTGWFVDTNDANTTENEYPELVFFNPDPKEKELMFPGLWEERPWWQSVLYWKRKTDGSSSKWEAEFLGLHAAHRQRKKSRDTGGNVPWALMVTECVEVGEVNGGKYVWRVRSRTHGRMKQHSRFHDGSYEKVHALAHNSSRGWKEDYQMRYLSIQLEESNGQLAPFPGPVLEDLQVLEVAKELASWNDDNAQELEATKQLVTELKELEETSAYLYWQSAWKKGRFNKNDAIGCSVPKKEQWQKLVGLKETQEVDWAFRPIFRLFPTASIWNSADLKEAATMIVPFRIPERDGLSSPVQTQTIGEVGEANVVFLEARGILRAPSTAKVKGLKATAELIEQFEKFKPGAGGADPLSKNFRVENPQEYQSALSKLLKTAVVDQVQDVTIKQFGWFRGPYELQNLGKSCGDVAPESSNQDYTAVTLKIVDRLHQDYIIGYQWMHVEQLETNDINGSYKSEGMYKWEPRYRNHAFEEVLDYECQVRQMPLLEPGNKGSLLAMVRAAKEYFYPTSESDEENTDENTDNNSTDDKNSDDSKSTACWVYLVIIFGSLIGLVLVAVFLSYVFQSTRESNETMKALIEQNQKLMVEQAKATNAVLDLAGSDSSSSSGSSSSGSSNSSDGSSNSDEDEQENNIYTPMQDEHFADAGEFERQERAFQIQMEANLDQEIAAERVLHDLRVESLRRVDPAAAEKLEEEFRQRQGTSNNSSNVITVEGEEVLENVAEAIERIRAENPELAASINNTAAIVSIRVENPELAASIDNTATILSSPRASESGPESEAVSEFSEFSSSTVIEEPRPEKNTSVEILPAVALPCGLPDRHAADSPRSSATGFALSHSHSEEEEEKTETTPNSSFEPSPTNPVNSNSPKTSPEPPVTTKNVPVPTHDILNS